MTHIYLASRSPRRRELLDQIGVRHTILDVDVDERAGPGESPSAYVQRLATDKARSGWDRSPREAPLPVMGADTAVVVGSRILGKPSSSGHAMEMITLLSGRSHRVLSAVALVLGTRSEVRTSTSHVWFRPTSAAERLAYLDSGEFRDKAGAYAIQGLAAAFISHLEGSYSGVMGLPLFETAELLAAFGCPVLPAVPIPR